MGKVKTKKTLTKRVRVTKNGKIVKKSTRIGHLKVKWSSAQKHRKARKSLVKNKGQRKLMKKLLRKIGRRI